MTTILNKKTLSYLALAIVVAFIVLIGLEINEYYFSSKVLKNTNTDSTFIKSNNKHITSNEKFEEVDTIALNNLDISEIESGKYNSIMDYLEQVEDPKLYIHTLGCYDNDQMIEDIKGKGETCKTYGQKVINIYNKKKPKKGESNTDYFLTTDGKVYSFAEICPVTSNQSRPLKCLYDEANKFNEMSIKVGNIIEDIQDKHEHNLNNIDTDMGYHIVDNNRLYNKEHIKDFIGYENYLGMNKDIYRNINDKINDLSLYSQKVKKILK